MGGFERNSMSGLGCVGFARGSSLLLCGSLCGKLTLFDARVLVRPMAHLPDVHGAATRLRFWLDAASPRSAVALVSSSEGGLCSLRLGLHGGVQSGAVRNAVHFTS